MLAVRLTFALVLAPSLALFRPCGHVRSVRAAAVSAPALFPLRQVGQVHTAPTGQTQRFFPRPLDLSFDAARGQPLKPPKAGWFSGLFGGDEGRKEADTVSSFDYDYDTPPGFPVDDLLSGTALSGRVLACCYQATRHGWDATAFHSRCDMKGPALVVGTTLDGTTFGGFMPLEWKSANDYRETDRDFLFYVPKDSSNAIRIEKRDSSPVYDFRRGGPQFGSEALIIGEPIGNVMGVFTGPDPVGVGIGDLKIAKSRLGLSHAKRKDGKGSLFGDSPKAELAEVRVFVSPEIAEMY